MCDPNGIPIPFGGDPYFTLSFFGPQWKKQLAYCGAVSGREEDKFAACGFHVGAAGQAPYIQEADLVLVCKKRYWNDLNPAHMDEEALSNYQPRTITGFTLERLPRSWSGKSRFPDLGKRRSL